MKKITLTALLAILATALVAPVGLAHDHGKHKGKKLFTTKLKGANEVPGPGDPDGKGHAWIRLDSKRDRVCFKVSAKGVAPLTAGHIHTGDSKTAGPVFVELFSGPASDRRHRRGCVATTQAKIDAIRANPAGYYVNVHNAEYPNGALRGQLGGKHRHSGAPPKQPHEH
jgi:hypothetical protein